MKLGIVVALLLAQEPPEAVQLAREAYEAARAGNTADAVDKLRRASGLAPANALYRSALGGIFEREGKLVAADREFTAALQLDPANPVLLFKSAAIGAQLEQHEAARGSLEKLLQLQPDHRAAAELLRQVSLDWGTELAGLGRYRAGLLLARDTAKRFPDSAAAQIMLGLFETRNQGNVAAVAAYRRAVELDSGSPEAAAGLGIAQSNAGMTADAQATFLAGIRRFPADAALPQAYGVLLVKMAESGSAGAMARAREMFESALRLNRNLAEPHYQLGNIFLEAGDAAGAEKHFQAAAAHGLDDARLHYAAARALRRLGKEEAAARHTALFLIRKQSGQQP